MSTRSMISRVTKKGKIETIYCHYDGYIEHNGVILLENYKTNKKVKKLIALGDLSSLGTSTKPNMEKSCVAYGRDRGEDDTQARVCDNMKNIEEQEYNYYWVDKTWMVNGKLLVEQI